MKKLMNNKYLYIQIFIAIFFISTISTRSLIKSPVAVAGNLDLTGWNFQNDGVVKLNGEWELYKNQLLTPEDISNNKGKLSGYITMPSSLKSFKNISGSTKVFQYATFRIRIKLNKDSSFYSIRLNNLTNRYNLWIDNTPIVLNISNLSGNLQSNPSIPPFKINNFTNNREITIVLQVSDIYHLNGMINSIEFGLNDSIATSKAKSDALYFTMFGISIILALYNIILFGMMNRDKSLLYCSIFSIVCAIRLLFVDNTAFLSFFNNINYDLLLKLAPLTRYLLVYFLLRLLTELYPNYYNGILTKLTDMITYVGLTLTIFGTPQIYNNYYLYLLYILIVALVSFNTVYAVFRALTKKEESSVYVTIGVSVVLTSSTLDVLCYNNVLTILHTMDFSFFIFILSFSMYLTKKFSGYLEKVENLSVRLSKLDKVKDEFLANTSHELRTPLNGIINICDSLLEGVSGDLNEQQRKNLSIVVQSGKRLSSLINDILDFSKMKNSDIKLYKSSVNIQNIFEVIHSMLAYLIKDKSVILENHIPDNLFVYADENRVKQILYNLIGNALKFTEIGVVSITAEESGNFINILIEDTGIGIKEDDLKNLFKPFEQIEDINNLNQNGIGLGLSITKGLVEIQGGKISVESTFGKGSKFKISLPKGDEVKKADAIHTNAFMNKLPLEVGQSTTNVQPTNSIEGKFKILIVDDEPSNIQVIVNILSMEGYSLLIASNGIEALKILDKYKNIDLVILDVMMPKLSGYEVCRKIRDTFSSVELPIIMVTAKNNSEDMIAAFNAGANDFITKPFEKLEIKARVNTLLEIKNSTRKLVSAETAFLQAQIKPHFLYNVLNTIEALCHIDADRASEIIVYLSEYLRRSFDFKNSDSLISLNNELSLVKSYLKIEKERFGEALNVEFNIDENIDIKLPPLLVQPLVENAVIHGLRGKKNGGNLKISIIKAVNNIIFKVEDDGKGMSEEKLMNLLNTKGLESCVGIKNVNRRLLSFYGTELKIYSKLNEGTSISFTIPII